MGYKFNPFTGKLDYFETSEAGSVEDGTISNPYTSLNVKKVDDGIYHKIKNNLESVVTKYQVIDGILVVDGVNTIL